MVDTRADCETGDYKGLTRFQVCQFDAWRRGDVPQELCALAWWPYRGATTEQSVPIFPPTRRLSSADDKMAGTQSASP